MKKIFKVLSLLAVSTLLVGCKNNGKGGSSEQPEPEPSKESLVLPHTLEEASVMEFKHMKPLTSEVMKRLSEAKGETENIEDLARYGKISELKLYNQSIYNYLDDPTAYYYGSSSFTDFKVYSNDYVEMEGSSFDTFGDKYYSYEDGSVDKSTYSGVGVAEHNEFFMNFSGENKDRNMTEPEKNYSWEYYRLMVGMPSQYLLMYLSTQSFEFVSYPVGYQEENGLTYFNFLETDTYSSSYYSFTCTYVEYIQTVYVINENNELQGIYEVYEEWADHNLLSGVYEMNLQQRVFNSLEIKYNPIPTCDAAKRRALLDSVPEYYIAYNEDYYFYGELYYKMAKATLNDEGKLAAAPSFPTNANSVDGSFFVDENTLAISFRPSISSSYGDYIALDLQVIERNFLCLKGENAGTEEIKNMDISANADLKAAIAEFAGGWILTYADVDYLVIPTYNKGFQGFALTVSALDPTSTVVGVTSILNNGMYL